MFIRHEGPLINLDNVESILVEGGDTKVTFASGHVVIWQQADHLDALEKKVVAARGEDKRDYQQGYQQGYATGRRHQPKPAPELPAPAPQATRRRTKRG